MVPQIAPSMSNELASQCEIQNEHRSGRIGAPAALAGQREVGADLCAAHCYTDKGGQYAIYTRPIHTGLS